MGVGAWIEKKLRSLDSHIESPGYQTVRAKLERYSDLSETVSPNEDLKRVLRIVDTALTNTVAGIRMPKYEKAWSRLHEVRGSLTQRLGLEDAIALLVPDMEGDLEYIADLDTRKRIADEFAALPNVLEDPRSGPRERRRARKALLEASEKCRLARDTRWLKGSMKRTRIALTGAFLTIVVVVAIGTLPTLLGSPSWSFFFGLGLFGALGGLMSSLLSAEPVTGPVMEFYIGRRLLYLRPVIGSALAIAAYLAIRGDVVKVLNLTAQSSTTALMFVAIAAGFSERLFVKRLFGSSDDSPAG